MYYIQNHNFLVDDLVAFVQQVAVPAHPSLPVLVGGHSMGGFVAALAAIKLQPNINGLLIFSPMIDVKRTMVMKAQEVVAGVLNRVIPKSPIVPGKQDVMVLPFTSLLAPRSHKTNVVPYFIFVTVLGYSPQANITSAIPTFACYSDLFNCFGHLRTLFMQLVITGQKTFILRRCFVRQLYFSSYVAMFLCYCCSVQKYYTIEKMIR